MIIINDDDQNQPLFYFNKSYRPFPYPKIAKFSVEENVKHFPRKSMLAFRDGP